MPVTETQEHVRTCSFLILFILLAFPVEHGVYLYGADTTISNEYKQYDRLVVIAANANNK